jgi:hypothetical protein
MYVYIYHTLYETYKYIYLYVCRVHTVLYLSLYTRKENSTIKIELSQILITEIHINLLYIQTC